MGIFNPGEEGGEGRETNPFSVAKATRKCHGHIKPTELKTEGKGEEDHISIRAPYLLCLFEPVTSTCQSAPAVRRSLFQKVNWQKEKKMHLIKTFLRLTPQQKACFKVCHLYFCLLTPAKLSVKQLSLQSTFLFIARQTHASPLGYASTGVSNYSRLTASAVVLISVEPELMTS